MTETKRLGRGLEALLGSASREQAQAAGALRDARQKTSRDKLDLLSCVVTLHFRELQW